jgi:hypothetical protein
MAQKSNTLLQSSDLLLKAVFSLNHLVERDKGTEPLLAHSIPEEALPREKFSTYTECKDALAQVLAEAEEATVEASLKQYLLDIVGALIAQSEEGEGMKMPYSERVARFTGLPGEIIPDQTIQDLQQELSADLARAGYAGSLGVALDTWRAQTAIAPEAMVEEATKLFSQSLEQTRNKVVSLRPECEIDFEPVRGVYYRGYSSSAGPFKAHITLNADLEWPLASLKHVVSHEGCPGHFAISASRNDRASQGLLTLEQRFFFANTPVTSINEGTCNLGAYLLGWFDTYDDQICLRSDMLRSALLLNMCFLYHNENRSEEDVIDYYKQEGSVTEASAIQTMRFVKHPLWHTSNPHYWHGTHRVFDAYHLCLRENRMNDLLHVLYEEIHTYKSLGIAIGMDS